MQQSEQAWAYELAAKTGAHRAGLPLSPRGIPEPGEEPMPGTVEGDQALHMRAQQRWKAPGESDDELDLSAFRDDVPQQRPQYSDKRRVSVEEFDLSALRDSDEDMPAARPTSAINQGAKLGRRTLDLSEDAGPCKPTPSPCPAARLKEPNPEGVEKRPPVHSNQTPSPGQLGGIEKANQQAVGMPPPVQCRETPAPNPAGGVEKPSSRAVGIEKPNPQAASMPPPESCNDVPAPNPSAGSEKPKSQAAGTPPSMTFSETPSARPAGVVETPNPQAVETPPPLQSSETPSPGPAGGPEKSSPSAVVMPPPMEAPPDMQMPKAATKSPWVAMASQLEPRESQETASPRKHKRVKSAAPSTERSEQSNRNAEQRSSVGFATVMRNFSLSTLMCFSCCATSGRAAGDVGGRARQEWEESPSQPVTFSAK